MELQNAVIEQQMLLYTNSKCCYMELQNAVIEQQMLLYTNSKCCYMAHTCLSLQRKFRKG